MPDKFAVIRGKGKGGGRGGPPPEDPLSPTKSPQWQVPSQFPEGTAKILRRSRISKKQFPRFAEQLTLFLLANCSADFAISIQDMIRRGDYKGMEMFAKMAGMLKNDSGVTVNLNQNNINVESAQDNRSFDTIVRALDERDRRTHDLLEAPVAVEDDDIIEAETEDIEA